MISNAIAICCCFKTETNEEVMTGFCNILEKFYPECVQKQSQALQQLAQFRDSVGIFGRDMVKTAAKGMPAHTWWTTFGGVIPELQHVAVQVLSQVNIVSCYTSFSVNCHPA